ncbi:hypothetical protein COJ96_25640, partial [Bacillus sp. AFS073361]
CQPSDRSVSPKPLAGSAEPGRCAAAGWRSRADDPAGTDGEPKVAMVFALKVFLFTRHSRSRNTENNISKTTRQTISNRRQA